MLDVVGVTISSVSLMIQLLDKHGPAKIKAEDEYKRNLRNLVSSLHFSKNLHAVAHEIMDAECTLLFDKSIAETGLGDFEDLYRSGLGRIYRNQIFGRINPTVGKYESIILETPQTVTVEKFSNEFKTAVGSLNQSYPMMVEAYKELSDTFSTIDDELNLVFGNLDAFYKSSEAFDKNKKGWKTFIHHKNRMLLSLADQTIANQIVILDELFLI